MYKRQDTYWSTTGNDKESFQISRPLDISVNSAGVATAVDFVTKLKSQTESDIKVKSLFIQDQIDVSDNLKLLLGGRFDSFDITVTDIKGGSAESRKDEEFSPRAGTVSYTHLRAHETLMNLVCRLLLEKKNLPDMMTKANQV